MKIVIAPDSFKESLTAKEVAHAIEKGWKHVFPDAEYVQVPMADGGEGTVQSLVDATNGYIVKEFVTGPLGNKVEGYFGIVGDGKTAVIEMAAASGIHYVPVAKRNPLVTTTRGTGELISRALDEGVERIILGLGGSATNDGGAGMAQALGAKLLNRVGEELPVGGGALAQLAKIDVGEMDERLQNVSFIVACDVDNPLTGNRGASAIFGPQKGATSEMVAALDSNLAHYAHVIREDLGKNVEVVPGAGAAGGLGAGVLAFLNAELKSGVDIVIEATNLKEKVKGADYVITGEGRIDGQTIYGKTPIGVAKTAKLYDIPVIGLAGCLREDCAVVYEHGIDIVFPIVPAAITLEEALRQGEQNLERTARNVAQIIKMSSRGK
ncbi:glycerate kinase [Priestia taiwanensis]|uniref:Glycerate kinase n=1 Tax=Priestia taiwanensis TaxID=1347902 RepID=A0A917AQU9_9BACI|nr:glycerate kinase [Priestia taiwanensis]MBM7363023.1 glycerate kinase [Priestia taiwanensis]GGE66980.1 glycerate kinase [Priestia taiwanensis]